jgi:hypothetical protein
MLILKSYSKFFILFTALSFLLISCDDSSTNTDDDIADASVSVTGDVNADLSGQAYFSEMDDGPGGIYSWQIVLNDFNPQTFSLQFQHVSNDPIEQPAEGTYEIRTGSETPFDENENPVFTGIYTDIEDGDYADATEYSTHLCDEETDLGGTLVIETSETDLISGTFEFTAANIDFDETGNCVIHGTIEVSGEFTASDEASF